jgi:iron complex transport system substrate-binding protein
VFLGRRRGERIELLDRVRVPRALLAVLAIVVALACKQGRVADTASRDSAKSAIELTDDAGNSIRLQHPARRIVSLVPSATETLIAIGARNDLVGRTRYDTASDIAALPSVGGGVDASVESIVNLRPDLVIAWQSDARQVTRERLVALGIPVFVVKTEDTTDIFRGIASLGRMAGADSQATAVAASVRNELDSVRRAAAGRPSPSVLYVGYEDPPMSAGPRTFIGQLISLAGGRSVITDSAQLWPNLSMEEIVRRDPDLLIVPVGEMSNPLASLRERTGWRNLRAVRQGHVVGVPADLVNRPSPSIAESARVFLVAIHPEIAVDSTHRRPNVEGTR